MAAAYGQENSRCINLLIAQKYWKVCKDKLICENPSVTQPELRCWKYPADGDYKKVEVIVQAFKNGDEFKLDKKCILKVMLLMTIGELKSSLKHEGNFFCLELVFVLVLLMLTIWSNGLQTVVSVGFLIFPYRL